MNLPNGDRILSISRLFRRPDRRTTRLRRSRFQPAVGGLEARTMLSAVPTTTALSATPATAVYGQLVDFTATVTANGASKSTPTPTGAVQFAIDGALYGKPVSLISGKASIGDAALAPGSHTIAVIYKPSISTFAVSAATAFRETITADATTTALSSSANPSSFGQPVTFTATVANASIPGGSTPTGNVQFKIDGAAYGSPVSLTKGTAVISDAALGAGSHTIAATFLPSTGNFSTSASQTVKQAVNADATTNSLAVSSATLFGSGTTAHAAAAVKVSGAGGAGSAAPAVSVTLTATVANASAHGAGTPTGTVQFLLNGSPLGAPQTLSGGQASLTVSPFSANNPTVTAVYTSYTGNFSGSSATLSSTQFPRALATVLAGEGAAPNQIAGLLHNILGLSQSGVTAALAAAGVNFTYNADGSAQSTTTVTNPDGSRTTTTYSYDANLNLTGTVTQTNNSAGQEVGYTSSNAAGQLLVSDSFTYTNGRLSSKTDKRLNYDSSGKLHSTSTVTTTLNANGNTTSLVTVTSNYNGNTFTGGTQNTVNFDGTPSDNVTSVTNTTFDSQDRPTSSETDNADGQATSATSYTYNGDSDTPSNVTTTSYSYNSNGTFSQTQTTSQDFDANGNPTSSSTLTDSYDSNGNLTGSNVTNYDADGQETSSTNYGPDGQPTSSSGDGSTGDGNTGSGDSGGDASGAGGGGGLDDGGSDGHKQVD
jgi:hypothetical protein